MKLKIKSKTKKKLFAIILTLLILTVTILKLFTCVLGKPKYIYAYDEDYLVKRFYDVDKMESICVDKSSLDKVKYCKNIKRCICSGFLRNLDNLDFLDTPQLEWLTVIGNVNDISNVRNFRNITFLGLHETHVQNLSDIITLSKLEELSLTTSERLDCSGIENLNNLKKITFSVKYLDCSQLSKLNNIEDIFIKCWGKQEDTKNVNSLLEINSLKKLTLDSIDISSDLITEFQNKGVEVVVRNNK